MELVGADIRPGLPMHSQGNCLINHIRMVHPLNHSVKLFLITLGYDQDQRLNFSF